MDLYITEQETHSSEFLQAAKLNYAWILTTDTIY